MHCSLLSLRITVSDGSPFISLQAIYSWRGANPKNMKQQFDKDYPLQTTLKVCCRHWRSSPSLSASLLDSEIHRDSCVLGFSLLRHAFVCCCTQLSTNYRSSRSIIEAASQVIADSEVDRGFGTAGPLTLVPAKVTT